MYCARNVSQQTNVAFVEHNIIVINHVFYTRISWCGCISLDRLMFFPSIIRYAWGLMALPLRKCFELFNAVSA